MTPERRAELKERCGCEPTLRATLADLEASLAPKLVDVDALLHRKAELLTALTEISEFKAELAGTPVSQTDTGESPSLSGDSQTHDEGIQQ